jgi:hypothetical protein
MPAQSKYSGIQLLKKELRVLIGVRLIEKFLNQLFAAQKAMVMRLSRA